jgi:DNA invertase Pin-like site-specific DNA recombinase
MKQTRVAIYTRASTDDQSTKTQEHELRQYAKNRLGDAIPKSSRSAPNRNAMRATTFYSCARLWRFL